MSWSSEQHWTVIIIIIIVIIVMKHNYDFVPYFVTSPPSPQHFIDKTTFFTVFENYFWSLSPPPRRTGCRFGVILNATDAYSCLLYELPCVVRPICTRRTVLGYTYYYVPDCRVP